MSAYINPQGEYPRYTGDIQIEHPEWQIGETLPEGWTMVVESDMPAYDYTTEIVESAEPALVDGVMTQQWAIRPLTAEELERINAPATAKAKLLALGLTEIEIQTLLRGL